jgi:DNA replication protein DnaC
MSDLERQARQLKLHGLLAHWQQVRDQPWLVELLAWEEQERARRGLERRIREARIGAFKPIADFDWTWPKKIDRLQVEDLFRLDWLASATNIVLVGPNGIGKTMIAKNLAHQAVVAGATARCLTASELLNTLADQTTSTSLQRKLARFCQPQLLVIDELAYLSYDARYADLLFEVVSRRYLQRPLLITTNKEFATWHEVFPNATSVVTLIDRLIHRCEILNIDGESYRLKESKEEARRRALQRAARRTSAADHRRAADCR